MKETKWYCRSLIISAPLVASVLTATTATASSQTVIHNTEFSLSLAGEEERWVELTSNSAATLPQTSWTNTFSFSSPIRGVVVHDPVKVPNPSFNPFSLLYEWHPRTTPAIHVSSSGKEDHVLCGHDKMPCLTLNGGVALTDIWTVTVVGEGVADGRLDVSGKQLAVSGGFGTETLKFSGNGQIGSVSGVDSKTTLTELAIDGSASSHTGTGSLFEIGGGSLVLTKCSIKPGSTLTPRLISMTGHSLTLDSVSLISVAFSATPIVLQSVKSASLQNVTVSKCKVDTILSCNGVDDLLIQLSTFTGITGPYETNTDDLCEWSTGLVELVDSNCTLNFASFYDLDDGAILMENSTLSIESSTFHDNTPNDKVFTSVHRNIRCLGESAINVGSLSGGDGRESDSMWISSEPSCTVMKNKSQSSSPFFVPTLSVSDSRSTHKNSAITLSLRGSLFIPCGLKLRVVEFEKNQENVKSYSLDFETVNPTKWTESELTLQFPESSIPLNATREWRGMLEFGDGATTSEHLVLKRSVRDERMSQFGNTMKWLGPVVGGVLALFLILLIIFLLLRRRRKQKKAQLAKEMKSKEELNQVEEKIEFVEDFNVGHTTNMINAAEDKSFLVETNASDMTKVGDAEKPLPRSVVSDQLEVVKVGDNLEVVQIEKKRTLYNILHKEDTQQLDRRQLQRKLTLGLARLAKAKTTKELFLRLSPHTIFFDANGEIHFRLKDEQPVPAAPPRRNLTNPPPSHVDNPFGSDGSSSSQPPFSLVDNNAQTGQPKNTPVPLFPQPSDNDLTSQSFFGSSPVVQIATGRAEGMRWRAPEVADNKTAVDETHCAVFSLGIILWEIETGLVPFGEIDEANASRQLCSGMPLKMDDIEDDGFKSLITSCLDLNPADRPSLETIAEFFAQPGKTTSMLQKDIRVGY
ncbi:hypothetical protein BLNAU_24033 [Blattamonas nauphoetae]|uniref:receptor protein-tyrosine kinase n=1 Tax=Blattamonas nauphoetae TaxID=2049346 RepID=A0ABQ9WQK7_9EUKA|nr:hypothetical protein BLNAU_24033 [Blattamonas nauphoetae]